MSAIDLDRQLRAANALLERQDEALEQIMRRAVHGQSLDLQSARRALSEIYQIARTCRNVEGE
ncbi:hypothetical protein [Burkholderia stagnalis]|uniref:EscE/YscE/SsaE family type III secretion system needle protein co-chaperone n=1 Tax=Burkholderia stagnalis TaxID=1503054 RepID=A0ABX9YTS2_9BURK|nr:hypothetical protein [Burkholderia stagnalis]RQQ64374.1 hypothetical protein DF158_06090 [Burkholderia stagnalis]RQR00002.1 hypothetical protein DF025_36710 [Burkholderia stagnalis]RQR15253.1 hypothetical protein DF021_06090 [Burkholderia stagnalis]RQR25155.1 hypothetical protein DF026_00045 [Burkholderia stagnalis]RQY96444.1 hypothetical protein DF017_07270 [Burkholderia stagnalis]